MAKQISLTYKYIVYICDMRLGEEHTREHY